MFFMKVLQKAAVDGKGIRAGFGYLLRGARTLLRERSLWPLIVGPVIINAALFALFIWGFSVLTGRFLGQALPETWWAVLIMVLFVAASVAAIIFFGSAFFVFFGSIISAPFYSAIAERMVLALGGKVPERPWLSEALMSVRHSLKKIGLFLLIQGALVILYIIPVAIGPAAYVTLGFFTTVFFLALDFLDFAFDHRGWSFKERRRWCLRRRGFVLGFGTAVFLGLAIPVVNLLIPPMAVAGAILLFHEHDGVAQRVHPDPGDVL